MLDDEIELTDFSAASRGRVPQRHSQRMIRKILCSPCYLLSVLLFSAVVVALVATGDLLFSTGEFGRPQLQLFFKYLRVLLQSGWLLASGLFVFLSSLYATFR